MFVFLHEDTIYLQFHQHYTIWTKPYKCQGSTLERKNVSLNFMYQDDCMMIESLYQVVVKTPHVRLF